MKILVVEDDLMIAAFLKKSFESESFVVDVAYDGERGSYAARTNEYDIIILDNMLPKKDGLTVCKEVRQKGKVMPIIMLSVKSDIPEKVALLNAGIDDYMTKPYSFDELLARVHAHLRSNREYRSTILAIGDLTIDSASQEVRMAGKEVYLTRKEFALLELLVRNRGKVVSRGAIMEHVWDMEGDPMSRAIETHILNIRKKVEAPKKKRFIFNVSGRGYKILDH